MLKFICIDQNRWQVDGQDCAGGMGPANFIDEWQTAEEAIKDILDFYFGDPTRMKRKADEKETKKPGREARKQASTEPI